ncbi:hypothetical protein ACFQT0_07060 [Hymenobacter humi]|uniref:Uncharacterized protein n=1 Tax=Hymenobacter humi TaxID=1411620 RepID=A0ABW2U1K4_9BACT
MPTPDLLLLRVAATWPLPGLGLLALPNGATPHLLAQPLHTALPVEIELTTGRLAGVGTVEEISRADTVERGLLLDFGPGVVPTLPAGTGIWLAKNGLPVSA